MTWNFSALFNRTFQCYTNAKQIFRSISWYVYCAIYLHKSQFIDGITSRPSLLSHERNATFGLVP